MGGTTSSLKSYEVSATVRYFLTCIIETSMGGRHHDASFSHVEIEVQGKSQSNQGRHLELEPSYVQAAEDQ